MSALSATTVTMSMTTTKSVRASGGITLETMPTFFSPHVDIISQGALTNGYDTLDFSLKVPKPEAFAARDRVAK